MDLKALNRFRIVAIIEAISYLLLLCVAMPIKYLMDMPDAVKWPGWIHGILFVAYIITLITAAIQYNWSFKRIVVLFLASLLPIVPFILEKRLKEEYAAKAAKANEMN